MERVLAGQSSLSACEVCGKEYTEREVRALGLTMKFRTPQCDCAAKEYERVERGRRVRQLLIESGIPERHWTDKMDNWEVFPGNERATRVVRDYCARLEQNHKDGKGIILSGPRGTGKTRLTAYVLTQYVKKLVLGVVMVTTSELHYEMKSADRFFGLVERLKNADVLAIDDLGESPMGWDRRYLFMVINHRYERRMTTIANTMRSVGELGDEKYAGGHIMSRLIEMTGKERIAEIGSEADDYRYKLAGRKNDNRIAGTRNPVGQREEGCADDQGAGHDDAGG